MNTKKVIKTGLLSKLLFLIGHSRKQDASLLTTKSTDTGYRVLSAEQVESERSKAYKYAC